MTEVERNMESMTFETNNIEDECNATADWYHERMDHLDIRGRLCRIVYALDLYTYDDEIFPRLERGYY